MNLIKNRSKLIDFISNLYQNPDCRYDLIVKITFGWKSKIEFGWLGVRINDDSIIEAESQ